MYDEEVYKKIKDKYGYPSEIDDAAIMQAQAAANDTRLYAGLGEAFSGLGRSIAGATQPADNSFYRELAKNADQPVQDILQQRKAMQDEAGFKEMQALQDPESMQSQVAQRIASQMGYDLSGLPMSQVKNVKDLMSADLNAKARAETLAALNSNRAQSKETRNVQRSNMDESQLRKELNALPTSKATQDVSVAYQKIIKAAESPSAAGDLSLIFSYMKILDPGSTVREGEQASASNAAGVPDKIRNTYNRIMSGERLVPAQRADFVNQAGKIFDSQMQQQQQVNKQYAEIAKRKGIDEKNVIVDFGQPRPQQPQKSLGVDQSAVDAEMKRRGFK